MKQGAGSASAAASAACHRSRAHAGGIAAERGDAKTAERILAGLTDEATAELDRVPVGDPALLECRSESRLVELRVVTRAREAPHIDERDDAGLANNGRELVDRTESRGRSSRRSPHQDAEVPDLPHVGRPSRNPTARCAFVDSGSWEDPTAPTPEDVPPPGAVERLA